MDQEQFKINLTIVRHGETLHNNTKTLTGHQPGKLTELGQNEARKAGKYLSDKSYDYVFTSDLARTIETYECAAEEASALKQLPRSSSPLLRERCFGIFENKPIAEELKVSEQSGLDIREFRAEKGQSWRDVMERLRQFLKELIKVVKQQFKAKEQINIVMFAHAGVIMEFHNVNNILNGRPEVYDKSAKNCSIHVFELLHPKQEQYDEKKIKIKCLLNNYADHMN